MKKRVCIPTLAMLALLGVATLAWSQPRPLSWGVIIWRSPTLTAQFWNPILRYVSEKSRVPLQLKVAATGSEHTAMVRRGELHFLYSNHNFITENEKAGRTVAAGVNTEILKAFAEREHIAYRSLWASEKYLNLAVSVHPAVPADTVSAVRKAVLEMADDLEGAKVLAAAAEAMKQPPLVFIEAKDSDFDNMRRFYRTTVLKVELQ